jgi:hypothetical protein
MVNVSSGQIVLKNSVFIQGDWFCWTRVIGLVSQGALLSTPIAVLNDGFPVR